VPGEWKRGNGNWKIEVGKWKRPMLTGSAACDFFVTRHIRHVCYRQLGGLSSPFTLYPRNPLQMSLAPGRVAVNFPRRQ
jgi:hypothetical protein